MVLMEFQTLHREIKKLPTKKKGDIFEQFTKQYLFYQLDGISQIYRWPEIPSNLLNIFGLNKKDIGVDILIIMKDGTYKTVQCKYIGNRYKKSTWSEISTFVSTSSLMEKKSGKKVTMLWFTNSYKIDKKMKDLKIQVVDGTDLDIANKDICQIICDSLKIKVTSEDFKPKPKIKDYGKGYTLMKTPTKTDIKNSVIDDIEFLEDIELIKTVASDRTYQTEGYDFFQKYRNVRENLSSYQINELNKIKYWWWTNSEMMWWVKYDNICKKIEYFFNSRDPKIMREINSWCSSEKNNQRFMSHTEHITDLMQSLVVE